MRQPELLKGNTDTLLLALLQGEPMYGYQIAKEVNQRSAGYLAFKRARCTRRCTGWSGRN